MKTVKFILAQAASLLVLGLMAGSVPADPKLPDGRDSSDVTDDPYYSSWASDCRSGWKNSGAYSTCTTRGTVRVDFTRKCTVNADCTTDDGGTKSTHHRGTAAELRTLVNCDGDLVRNACPPPPPPPEPAHPRDSVDVTTKLTEYNYQTANATCLVGTSWHTAPFVTWRNCWDIDIQHKVDVTIQELFEGRLCKVTATCRTWLEFAGAGRVTNDLKTSIQVKASDIKNIYECDGALQVGACPAGKQGTDRRQPASSQ